MTTASHGDDAPPAPLSDSDGKELCRIALTTLREYAYSGNLPPGAPHRKSLLGKSAAAVHLYDEHKLRGSAILVEAEHPLYYTVELAAVQAGFFDPRGERVTSDDVNDLRIVVTVLGPTVTLADPAAEVDPTQHAVVVRRGPCQGAFTPECVREQRWSRDEFLEAIWRSVGARAGETDLVWQVFATHSFSTR